MGKPIFCSIYSVDNKRKMQVWFIKEFRRRVSSHEEGKHLRIESDWESIKPAEELFNDRCKESKYTMFLFDGTDDVPDLRTLKHYHAIANALDRKGETQFVPIGLCTKARLGPFESLIGQYNLIRFESVSDIENENSWKSLFKDIFPDKEPPQLHQGHPGRDVVFPPSPYQSRERSEDVLMRRVLRSLWAKLKNGLKYTMDSIVDHLYQDDIITTELKEELGSKSTMNKPELLLNFIRERPAEQIQRFVDLLKLENKHLYDEFVKMKKKFEEDAAALEQSAEIPAAQSCPVSSSSFTGARYPPNQSPVGLSIQSTDSHEETLRKTEPFEETLRKTEPFEETLRKTEPFEEKFKKAEPIEGTHKRADELPYVTQQISQVSLGGTLGEVPENRDQTQPPSLTLGWDGPDGSDAASESVERGAESNQQKDVSNTSGNPSLNFQSGMISMRGDPSSRSTFNMKVRRCEVLNDLFDIFHKEKLENILQCKVNAEFAGEANGSGVLLDILSAYWEEFFENYSEGEDEKVLQAHTDLIKDNLKCAGRILRFGFQYCPETEPLQFFPHQLCLASIINVIHPNSISDDMTKYKAIWSASLYAHFGAISGEKIKAIYEDPKSASEGQWQNINNILDDFFEKNYLVNADNIRDKLSHLAEVHLLQKSKTSLELMGFHDWKKLYPEHFGDIDKIVEFSKQFHPTSDDVLKAFKKKENINKEEAAALKNLEKVIRGLTLVELKKFLRFVTGSALKPKQISVEFSNDEHRPFNARTCSSLLYIPLNVKYNKFKGMLMKIINDEMNQDMTWVLPHDQQ